jgi:hypothetical protein
VKLAEAAQLAADSGAAFETAEGGCNDGQAPNGVPIALNAPKQTPSMEQAVLNGSPEEDTRSEDDASRATSTNPPRIAFQKRVSWGKVHEGRPPLELSFRREDDGPKPSADEDAAVQAEVLERARRSSESRLKLSEKEDLSRDSAELMQRHMAAELARRSSFARDEMEARRASEQIEAEEGLAEQWRETAARRATEREAEEQARQQADEALRRELEEEALRAAMARSSRARRRRSNHLYQASVTSVTRGCVCLRHGSARKRSGCFAGANAFRVRSGCLIVRAAPNAPRVRAGCWRVRPQLHMLSQRARKKQRNRLRLRRGQSCRC